MKNFKTLAIGLWAVVLVIWTVVGINACAPQQLRDLENVPVEDMQNVRIYVNVDNYANTVVGCVESVAFVFTTRDYEAIMRVPELDAEICGAQR